MKHLGTDSWSQIKYSPALKNKLHWESALKRFFSQGLGLIRETAPKGFVIDHRDGKTAHLIHWIISPAD